MFESYLTAISSTFGISGEMGGVLASSAVLITILEVITAVPTGRLAKRKGRSMLTWSFFALMIPIVPLLVVWLLPELPPTHQALDGNTPI